MNFLITDWETRSELNVKEVGTPVYFSHPSTQGLMLSWGINHESLNCWEHDEPSIPARLMKALLDPSVLKLAWNVAFERGAFKKFWGIDIPIEQWMDVKVLACYFSLPGKLKKACNALHLPPEIAKMAETGKRGITLFSMPAKRIAAKDTLFGHQEELVVFNTKKNKPAEWEEFKGYCIGDSRVERYIFSSLDKFMLPKQEIALWHLDQRINERGMPVNRRIVECAVRLAHKSLDNLRRMLEEKTGLANPNSDDQMLGWLQKQGYKATSLNKKVVEVQLREAELTPLAREVIIIRKEFKRSSWTKLEAILQRLSADDRLRDLFAFMGASRTGRWAGQDVQFQNLARPDKKVEANLKLALELLLAENFDAMVQEFAPEVEIDGKKVKIPSVLSVVVSCLRSAFEARPGHTLVVCDLSAIENRVLGWLAGCYNILKVFKDNLDPYLSFACHMYGIPYEQVTKAMRQIAKPAVLGCGYGLGPGVRKIDMGGGAFEYRIIWQCTECKKHVEPGHACYDKDNNRMGDLMKTGLLGYAENMGVMLTPEQAFESHAAFRKAYPEVPQLWKALERAAIRCIQTGKKTTPVVVEHDGDETIRREIPWVEYSRVRFNNQWVLRCKLPSGRYLHYINARVHEEEKYSERTGRVYTQRKIYYDGIGHGVGATSKGANWGQVYTYGGKLAENIVQAISRDILAYGMMLAEKIGFWIVGHVHDEIIAEVREDPFRLTIHDLKWCMSQTPPECAGLPLAADGYESKVYKKG